MYRSFAVAAALGFFVSLTSISSAQTTKPATKPADKAAPKTNAGGGATGGGDVKFATNDEKLSYGIGLQIGGEVKQNLMAMAGPMFKVLKLEAVLWGIKDGLMEEGSRVSETELEAARTDFQKRMEVKVKELATTNMKAAQTYLAANKGKAGVQATKSGLQYKVVKKGTGAKPKPTDVIKVHYQGTKTDGSVFDGTDPKGEPAMLEMQKLIPGWKEALSLMKVGDKWTLYVPPELAYREEGYIGIEPNQLLIFDLELVGIAAPDDLQAPSETADDSKAKPETKAASSASGSGTTKKPAAPR